MYCSSQRYLSAASVVRVGEKTKTRLDRQKLHPRKTDDDVIAGLTDIAIDDEPLSVETLEHLRRSEEEITAGRACRGAARRREYGKSWAAG